MIEPRRSAVIVPVELPEGLGRIRRQANAAAAHGVPAHVTILIPFVDPGELDGTVLARLGAVVIAEPSFVLDLARVRSFPAAADTGTVYLAPEPAGPFVQLTQAIWAAFPGHPPYGGQFDTIVPHLTIADGLDRLAAVEAAAAVELPVRRVVDELWLIVEGEDGRWTRRARLPLGGPERAGDEPAREERQAE